VSEKYDATNKEDDIPHGLTFDVLLTSQARCFSITDSI
jgi:hypothetical protein